MPRPTNVTRRFALALALALLGLDIAAASSHGSQSGAAESTTLSSPASTPSIPPVCESRTINYITHTLPQQCLRTSWSSPVATSTDASVTAASTVATEPVAQATQANGTQQEGTAADDDDDTLESSFMSFEEWKEMMLRKSGQDPETLKARKQREQQQQQQQRGEHEPPLTGGEADNLGDDGEVDYDTLTEKISEITHPAPSNDATPEAAAPAHEEQVQHDDSKAQVIRSKDAGKTCKERFSYSSFDAGATILKTSPGAKSPKSILVENKDSYMLLECRTKNKFVIVELSDDILVDTVVIANFEFFSSMIRTFRVSASDRYPVKMDKWVDLGTFEARNSRDIQAFLVEHPQIYTKYIRIEFLTHYGNEYYCPVSLLRVHGIRMLDTWKEASQDDEVEQIDGPNKEAPVVEDLQEVHDVVHVPVENTTEQLLPNSTKPAAFGAVTEMGLSPWTPIFFGEYALETCNSRSPTTGDPTPVSPVADHGHHQAGSGQAGGSGAQATARPGPPPETSTSDSAGTPPPTQPQKPNPPSGDHPPPPSPQQNQANNSTANPATANANSKQPPARPDAAADSPPSPRAAGGTNTTPRNKTSTTSSAPSSPTVQESFFKTVNKRLQILEANTSLSFQYIEDQSRMLHGVLNKQQRKQIKRIENFLDDLNKTVLSDLRTVRTQYDQIWQSTVLALEAQRERSEREIVALTTRLNVLADEVVFQKRMAIIQSVLLLSCLILVIFSRGGLVGTPVDSYGANGAAQYRRYGRPSSLFSTSPPPVQMPGAESRLSTGSIPYSSATVSTAAIPRHMMYSTSSRNGGVADGSDKTLPLTPVASEYGGGETSQEGTPVAHVDSVRISYDEESTPDRDSSPDSGLTVDSVDGSPMEPGSEVNGDSSGGGGANGVDPSHSYQNINQPLARETPPLTRNRPALSQLGSGVRKPLPALPEDPS